MDKFVDMLREAATTLGLEAVRVWPQIVGITFVKSVFYCVVAVGLIAVSGWGLRVLYRLQLAQVADKNGFMNSDWGPMPTVIMALPLALILICLLTLGDNLPGVFYPEAKTVLDLISKVK